MRFRPLALSFLATFTVTLLLSAAGFADSQARIVRLSSVEGNVAIDRHLGNGFERAFINLPITQGTRLRAGDSGRAEVELEDGSTVRIVPGSVIEFRVLSARDSGGKVSAIALLQGTVYVNFAGGKDDEFSLGFVREQISLMQSAHLRVQVGDSDAAVAVFKGEVQVAGDSGTVTVGKKQTVSFDLSDSDHYKLAKNLQEDPFDGWDKQQDQYHQRYLASNYSSYSPYAYGASDLNYYGNFFNAPGYGTVWQPYFAGAGWDPFMNGAWAFSGLDYGWVSGYPWGWTPYHYGSWAFAPGYGWVWQPGGAWYGYSGPIRVLNAPKSFVAPQAPSSTTKGTVVVVNRGPQLATNPSNKIFINSRSAGLGIPRGGIGNMAKVSAVVAQKGSTSIRAPQVVNQQSFAGSGQVSSRNAPAFSPRSAGVSAVGASAPSSAHAGGTHH